ncbi:MAG: deoxynucleotide monophosphate kinase family protein [Candidatus Hodarchaeales archaeon]|jgi:dephospho-CoA kinase
MRLLLGITGQMGSGKSTVGSYLASKYGFKRLRISGKMREIAKELDIQPSRDFLQGIGQFMRGFDDDVWVKYVGQKVQNSSSPIVIDDIRRENEIKYLCQVGFKFIRVESSSLDRKNRIEKRSHIKISDNEWERWASHSTEIQVPFLQVDYIITNNETIEYLEKRIDEIIQTLGFKIV